MRWRGFSVRQNPFIWLNGPRQCGRYLLREVGSPTVLLEGVFEHPMGMFSLVPTAMIRYIGRLPNRVSRTASPASRSDLVQVRCAMIESPRGDRAPFAVA